MKMMLCSRNPAVPNKQEPVASDPGQFSRKAEFQGKTEILGSTTDLLSGVDAGEIGRIRFAVFFNCHLHIVSM